MLNAIQQIVIDAGELIRHVHTTPEDISSKEGRANYVTRYDVMVQEYLFTRLSSLLPEAVLIGEENADEQNADQGYAFIVDPIDGTANFIAGHHLSCISVGLALNGQVILGVIYNPFNQEMFWAERGHGAWKKDPISGQIQRLQMIDRPIPEGLVHVGTSPYYPELTKTTLHLAYKILERGTDIRRFGAAAVALSYLADCRSVLFFELCLSPWDYAAACLIVEEAGGVITTMDNEPLPLNGKPSVLAGTPAAHKEFLQMIQELKQNPDLSWHIS